MILHISLDVIYVLIHECVFFWWCWMMQQLLVPRADDCMRRSCPALTTCGGTCSQAMVAMCTSLRARRKEGERDRQQGAACLSVPVGALVADHPPAQHCVQGALVQHGAEGLSAILGHVPAIRHLVDQLGDVAVRPPHLIDDHL